MWLERGKSKKSLLLSASVNGKWWFRDCLIKEILFLHLEIGTLTPHRFSFEIPILNHNLIFVPNVKQHWVLYLKASSNKTFVFEDVLSLKTFKLSNHRDDCYSVEYTFESFEEKITSQ